MIEEFAIFELVLDTEFALEMIHCAVVMNTKLRHSFPSMRTISPF